ncbi:NACHT domain-containing protein [Nostoc sp. LEGE 12450]|uniref:NACHT domain-containing protein n=1 Tax=Nostoc sp. LEGE 12450 TaxID=1828643 RepID=UPI00187E1A20|nr:NACHT domain-containing protein [Nostoc sp. LEGE 12450]MBE8990209.1 NACHT domain-containing protein [Nostoc sp. LEGE 12450]
MLNNLNVLGNFNLGNINQSNNIFIQIHSQDTQKVEIDWYQVSCSLLNEQQRLTTNPLTSSEGITYRTDQVYVPLGLVERKKQSRRREDISPEKGSELYHETEITQTFENQQFLEQVLRYRQSPKSQGKRIAIIGEPGAGKTTLLQQMAQWISKKIEQSVVIWVSLADLRSRELESYLLEVWLQAVARKVGQAEASNQIKDDFVAQFNQGLVWLVLDGVDEMQTQESNPLEEIERQIRTGALLQQSRIVLSCRLNLWDGGSNALYSFDNYRTLDFSYPQQVEQFIVNWFCFLPSAETQTGQRLCAALRESGKERIRDLVKNPLRLILLCFNWYLGEGKLPETKAGLYEQFVADFYEWKKGQFATTREQRKRLNAALGELAREAIDKEATRFRLRQEFVCKYLGEPDEPNSLFQLALQIGWLNKIGVDADNPRKGVYAFFHPTFQEYFAALTIEDWHYFLNHIPENPNHIDAIYRVFEPQWQEVILLWLGQEHILTKNKYKQDFLTILFSFEDNSNGFYKFESFFLAGLYLTEVKAVDLELSKQIINQLITLAFGFYDFQDKQWKYFYSRITPIAEKAKNILVKTDTELASNIIKEKLTCYVYHNNILEETLSTSRILLEMCVLLWELKPESNVARQILIDTWLKDENLKNFVSEDTNIMFDFAKNFYGLSQPKKVTKPKVSSNGFQNLNLIEELKNCQDFYRYQQIISELQQHKESNSQEIPILIEIVKKSVKSYLKEENQFSGNALFAALERLTITGVGNEEVINTFVELISIQDSIFLTHAGGSQRAILGGLASVSIGNINVFNLLLDLIHNDSNHITRICAIQCLEQVAQGEMLETAVKNLKRYIKIPINAEERFLFTACEATIFYYAERLSYPSFFQAWHS